MTNLQQHITEWLDSIGADGLMLDTYPHKHIYTDIGQFLESDSGHKDKYVPAYRHADGSYHAEAECCMGCKLWGGSDCGHPDIPCR